MNTGLHKKARTAPEIRREIQASDLPATVLARKYGVHRHTLRKWRKRDSVEDASHRPHRIHATLSPPQEAVVVARRETLLLPRDDLPAATHEFIHLMRECMPARARCIAAWVPTGNPENQGWGPAVTAQLAFRGQRSGRAAEEPGP